MNSSRNASSPGMGSAQTMFDRRMQGRSCGRSPAVASALGAEPEGEPGDLDGARIDVDAVEMLDDEAGTSARKAALSGYCTTKDTKDTKEADDFCASSLPCAISQASS